MLPNMRRFDKKWPVLRRWPFLKLMLMVLVVLFVVNILYSSANLYNERDFSRSSSDATNNTSSAKELKTSIAVVVVSCHRSDVSECLDSIMNANGFSTLPFDYYISQGCRNEKVSTLVKTYHNFTYMEFIPSNVYNPGYISMSWHFKSFLTKIFDELQYPKVILIEDDLLISADFFEYFMKMKDLLDIDETVLCISAWNDNGYHKYAHDTYTFQRTEFFPGYGWMITKKLWDEIKNGWPDRYWDEYFRNPLISKGRSCVYPEVSRTENIGKFGTSGTDFYLKYILPIKRNTQKLNYDEIQIENLTIEKYTASFIELYQKAIPVNITHYDAILTFANHSYYKIEFKGRESYQELCNKFDITYSTRYHIPRTSYHKITLLNLGTHKVFLYPSSDSLELDEKN
ncbi:Alpha-1,3-mannosyl-glycoprotein 2-beta-N-acetylglucosaminyltransferase [Thelohanellus kitauei]|uniref:Alpha-1,3-mannosyl-glycoprotein 2-beta-N-acetylglucosaminyltransferase n=1 Tax=Thelohanellus kitauei TaxID=669202 RepID=A0A0C2IWL5_THEKT|nr:Alpha-1,3-mannosyl-glycoprotein 2-beta-N-acetylglucosaminyltransferase [Thelohanellus kitauei]